MGLFISHYRSVATSVLHSNMQPNTVAFVNKSNIIRPRQLVYYNIDFNSTMTKCFYYYFPSYHLFSPKQTFSELATVSVFSLGLIHSHRRYTETSPMRVRCHDNTGNFLMLTFKKP